MAPVALWSNSRLSWPVPLLASVNRNLISFLQAISAVNPSKYRWRSSGILLAEKFGTKNKKHEYVAVTND